MRTSTLIATVALSGILAVGCGKKETGPSFGQSFNTIQGVSGALGTVQVEGMTSGVTIGGSGAGFMILGTDFGFPFVVSAAVYFRGVHTNPQVLDNQIVAAGDAGMLAEFGATMSGTVPWQGL